VGVKYPHMVPSEAAVWDAYLQRYGVPAGKVEYDVHLGRGAPVDPEWPEWMKRMVWSLSTHRADVVVERSDSVVIIEVKEVAGMSAVGQLLGYEALWLAERGVERPVELMVVCRDIESDMMGVFAFYEIEVVVVGDGAVV